MTYPEGGDGVGVGAGVGEGVGVGDGVGLGVEFTPPPPPPPHAESAIASALAINALRRLFDATAMPRTPAVPPAGSPEPIRDELLLIVS